jgi:hypothetical protein
MKATQLREFKGIGVAGALLVGGQELLEIDPNGYLAIPAGTQPKGFHLMVAVLKNGWTFVVQKAVGTEGGDYDSPALSEFRGFAPGFKATIMRDPIDVIHAGQNTWTGWHKNAGSNRVDVWCLGTDGKLDLYQIGIFTHDNGKSWRLHGEYRWRGQLYRTTSYALVAKPEHPKWGSLEGGTSRRTQIFQHPDFVALLKDAELPTWTGTNADIDPPLPEPTEPGTAVVQWYIAFAGQTGQGPLNLHKQDWLEGRQYNGGVCKTAWVHATDIEGLDPDADGETRLWRGDTISFEGMVENWGSKKGGPPKLTGVKLVKRA